MEPNPTIVSASPFEHIRRSEAALFEHDFLAAHNKFRAQHKVGQLQMNPALCTYAQKWAEFLARNDLLENRPDNVYGENLYMVREKPLTGDEPVKAWYSEIDNYNFSNHKDTTENSKFTQVVWKASKELGLGVVKLRSATIVVANYYPAGNIVGEFEENVLPKITESSEESYYFRKQSSMVLGCKPVPEKRVSFVAQIQYDAHDEAILRNDILVAHNNYRALHGVPPLRPSSDIDIYAKEWAQHLANRESPELRLTSRSTALEPRPHNDYGENLYKAKYKRVTGAQVVRKWYEQIRAYDFSKPHYDQETGGFTQLVWKSSQYLGIGIAKNDFTTFIVANYHPQGNFFGQFIENVLPPLESAHNLTFTCSGNVTAGEERQFNLSCLVAHNEYRKKHGAPPLKLNQELSARSINWARHLAEHDILAHDPANIYGENVYRTLSRSVSGEDPVKFWYSEMEHYDFAQANCNPITGHFTQLIWKSSRELGVGMAVSKSNAIYVVATYNPAGNYSGYFHLNVMAPIKDISKSLVRSDISFYDNGANAINNAAPLEEVNHSMASKTHNCTSTFIELLHSNSAQYSTNPNLKDLNLPAQNRLMLVDLAKRQIAGNCGATTSTESIEKGSFLIPVEKRPLLKRALLQSSDKKTYLFQANACNSIQRTYTFESQRIPEKQETMHSTERSGASSNEKLAYTEMEELMHWLENWSKMNN